MMEPRAVFSLVLRCLRLDLRYSEHTFEVRDSEETNEKLSVGSLRKPEIKCKDKIKMELMYFINIYIYIYIYIGLGTR
jgi:hypothetical protein